MNIKSEVENIIKKRWQGLKDPKELISLYGIEKQTNQGYNGRQLLELFQNCEDEGASKVRIFLDRKNCILEISNDGNKPFSIKGYDSIFYPGLSSKVSSGFIGNKGLGFRSIINWADQISIISNNFKVVFNPDFRREILLDEIGYSENQLNDIRKERNLNSYIYPLPFLNSCKILDLDTPHLYTTTISIKYKKEFEEDILKQLESISSKTLLFLQNINSIEIDDDIKKELISVSRKRKDEISLEINYNGETYYVLSDEGIVDDDLIEDNESSEPKRYSVKIAYNYDLSYRDNFLYNYFKTQIPFELPFVVHASLELDQNRNHSTESKLNPFILDKLFKLHLKLIEILKNKLDKSWLPYQSIIQDSFLYKPYAEMIDRYWDNFEVYPTLSGAYLNSNQAKNLGNDISKFIKENKLESYFKEQIVFFDLNIHPEKYIKKPDNYIDIIHQLSKELNINQRAKFIKLLLEHYPNQRFLVLIDEQNKLIDIDDYVYTEKTSSNVNLKVPNYSNIRFIHPELYNSLINELGLQSEINKSRTLKEKLEKISDVHSFEPQVVIKKIISETNTCLSQINSKNNREIIFEFYKVLFHNFKLRDEYKLDYDSKIPCFNRLNNLVDIKSIVLSQEFEIGKISREIFGELYEDEYIISNVSKLGLENENLKDVEEFLKWLGINQYVVIEKKNTDISNNYINYINKKHNLFVSNYELFSIKHFSDIFSKETININNIIAWCSLDETLKDIFSNYTATHSSNERLFYNYYGTKALNPFINYIYYSISSHFEIDNYLITNKREEWFNPFKIDYEYLKEINFQLEKKEIDRILSFFGAKKDFNNLDVNFLKNKTQELAERNNHKGSQVFYKNLVGHYKENNNKIVDVLLYAREGDNIIVKESSKVYFSDRIQLPQSLTSKFPIFYYPSRSGGSTAIEMFGLQNLNDLDLQIIKIEINTYIEYDFNVFLKEIKPFILAFRLDKITSEPVKIGQVQRLNKLKINCRQQLICNIEDEEFEIEPLNYIFINDQFYINIPNNFTLLDLKNNKQFIDNLSDIFLKSFDTLDEKKIFESIIKQSNEDNVYDINNELAEGILEEAKILLGEISVRLLIWKAIFKLKGIENQITLNDNNLEEFINHFFPEIENKILFNSDDNFIEIQKIRNIFGILNIDLKEYNSISDYKISFDSLFQKELHDFYNLQIKNVKNQLWNYLKDKNIEEQSNFLKDLYKVEKLLQFIVLDKNLNSYDFNEIILNELKRVFTLINFELDFNEFQDYDLVEQENIKYFSNDELLKIRKEESLNSLSYFEGKNEYIKSRIKDRENISSDETNNFNLDKNQLTELVEDFKIEITENNLQRNFSNNPWLGNTNELSANQKKKLGLTVEEIVKKYLDGKPDFYEKVEHISKTDEGSHYDIKYFDPVDQKIKYVECKYYNGMSFFLSREEKNFAYSNLSQYEIWLVNKDYKIFCIKDIKKLGELQPLNYQVNLKLKKYEIVDERDN